MVKNHAVLPRADRYVDVAIIGAGFSGSMVAVHLAHTLRCAPEIALIEKQRRTGPGIAYGTDNPLHLLNVPVGKMGAYPEKPSHFLEWLREHPDLVRQYRLGSLTDETFVPRSLFGLYLEFLVQRGAIRSRHVHRFEREAVDLVKGANGSFHVVLADNTTIFARKVVLALGNFPPGDPVVADQRFHRSNNYLTDPWGSTTLEKLSQTGDILILGSGLTALDLILSLNEMKQNGTIYVLSRHGHFPHRHARTKPYAFEQSGLLEIHKVRSLLRAVRNEVSLAERVNINWRSVIDALRPQTQAIWQGLDLAERRRFFRHLRPYWEIYRHRAAPEALDIKEAMEKAGRLRCYQGRVERIVERENTLFVKFWNRSRITGELAVSLVINCTGPECNYHKLKDPLVLQLFLRGLARPDPLFLGFDVNEQGQLIDVTSRAVPNLYTLGSTQKGRLLETTEWSGKDVRENLRYFTLGEDGIPMECDAERWKMDSPHRRGIEIPCSPQVTAVIHFVGLASANVHEKAVKLWAVRLNLAIEVGSSGSDLFSSFEDAKAFVNEYKAKGCPLRSAFLRFRAEYHRPGGSSSLGGRLTRVSRLFF